MTAGQEGAELLTPKEVAAILRVSARTLKNWRTYSGGPPYVRIGRQVRYSRAEVAAWAELRGSDTEGR